MANKRNQPKPGSQWRGNPKDKHSDDETFREMCFKAQSPRKCNYDGNFGTAQLPMKERAANLLNLIQKNPWGIRAYLLEKRVLAKLIKDGSVKVQNESHGDGRESKTVVIATNPIERPEFEEAAEPVEPKVVKKTIMWTKAKDQKLLMEVMMGTADQDLVDAVGKTKTKMRKITK